MARCMINRGDCILIVFHFYCCSKHKYLLPTIRYLYQTLGTSSIDCRAKILIQNIIEVFCVFLSLYIIYDWITVMG